MYVKQQKYKFFFSSNHFKGCYFCCYLHYNNYYPIWGIIIKYNPLLMGFQNESETAYTGAYNLKYTTYNKRS